RWPPTPPDRTDPRGCGRSRGRSGTGPCGVAVERPRGAWWARRLSWGRVRPCGRRGRGSWPHPGVEQRVHQVRQMVHEDHRGREDHEQALDKTEVGYAQAGVEEPAEAGPGEHG